jgi:hypothetical protein
MGSILVTINDETGTGKIIRSNQIEFSDSLVTVEQIIEQRVMVEVEHFNAKGKEIFYGLIQPEEAEVELNGFKMRTFKPIDYKKQVEVAKEAYRRNGFFILIDNLQPESLQQNFVLHQDSKISFVKLTPLVGG